MRQCTSCNETYPATLEYFYAHAAHLDGLTLRCKKCLKRFARKHKLRRNFNISLEDYATLLEKQNGVCHICDHTCITGRALAVDHNHKTGQVRGLICYNCNIGIGKFQESANLLFRAANYVKEFE